MLHIAILDKDNLKKFEEALRKFVKERPRWWVELLTVCVAKVDYDAEQVLLNLSIRHRDSWQSCETDARNWRMITSVLVRR